jgi:hypothetical protein
VLKKLCRIAALAATLAAAGAMSVAAAPASATFTPCTPAEQAGGVCFKLTPPFLHWHVSGSLTAGGQKTTLPVTGNGNPFTSPDGFTGWAEAAIRSPFLTTDFLSGEFHATCPPNVPQPPLVGPCGNITPPFTRELEFPAKSGEHQEIGLTSTEVPKETDPLGEFHTTAPANCPSPVLGKSFDCVHEVFNQAIELTYSVHGPGAGIASKTQSQCETVGPVNLGLNANLTFEELAFVGTHFVGSTTVPSITCAGKYGGARGNQMTETFSGPATYDICVQPVAPPPVQLPGCPKF